VTKCVEQSSTLKENLKKQLFCNVPVHKNSQRPCSLGSEHLDNPPPHITDACSMCCY